MLETGAHDNTIGGTAPGAGNLVSGNALSGITLMGAGVSNNVVHGNRIGTDALVTTAIPNLSYGVNIADAADNVIGGSGVGARNIISGNRRSGVFIGGTDAATGNIVLNNFIGTNGSGMSGIGNGEHGVLTSAPLPDNSIGAAGAGNVISGNVQNGIAFFGVHDDRQHGQRQPDRDELHGDADRRQRRGRYPDRFGFDQHDRWSVDRRRKHDCRERAARHRYLRRQRPATGSSGNVVGLREPPNVLGNGLDGIQISNGSNNTIGGPAPGEGNTISWNGRTGVRRRRGHRQPDPRATASSPTPVRGIDLLNDGLTANDSETAIPVPTTCRTSRC